MPKEGVQEIAKIPELKDLDFEVPSFSIIEDVPITKIKTIDATFNGAPITINIENDSYLDHEDCLYIQVKIEIFFQKEIIVKYSLLVEQLNDEKSYIAETSIDNFDKVVLKGIGRALWENLLKLIQKLSIKLNATVKHKVTRLPPRPTLKTEKWNELFFDILERHGYKEKTKGIGIWEKTYFPKTQ